MSRDPPGWWETTLTASEAAGAGKGFGGAAWQGWLCGGPGRPPGPPPGPPARPALTRQASTLRVRSCRFMMG